MRLGDRSSTILLAVITIVLALAVGLIIPLAAGNSLGGRPQPWTPPPSPTPTSVPPTATALPNVGVKSTSPTATRVQPTATRTAVATLAVTVAPTVTVALTTSTVISPTATLTPGAAAPACPGARGPVGPPRRPEPNAASPQLRPSRSGVHRNRSHRRQRLAAGLLREQRAGVVSFAIRGSYRHPHDSARETIVPQPLLGEDHR